MGNGAYYRKRLVAGCLVKETIVRRAVPSDSPKVRAMSTENTEKARQVINGRNSTEKLEMLIACNFDTPYSYFVTATFDNKHLPPGRPGARKNAQAYFRLLREEYKKRGLPPLRYIYALEGERSGSADDVSGVFEFAPWEDREHWEAIGSPEESPVKGHRARLHTHTILNAYTETEKELILSLWGRGDVHIERLNTTDEDSFGRLAAYMTKETRQGVTRTGDRSFTPSLNLAKPKTQSEWIKGYAPLIAPDGAYNVHQEMNMSDYGTFAYIKYRLPKHENV